ncbi:MAG: Lrp/AsnC family transcriptional regulator [Candidatus Woesearchaeota archaeon]
MNPRKILKEKEIMLLSHIRCDARVSLTKLSKLTKMPISTIFDKIKEYETKKIIKRNIAILDFNMLGYDIRNQLLISVVKEQKQELQSFLIKHPRVNTIHRVNNEYDFIIETIFKNTNDMDDFMQKLDKFKITDKKEFLIMEDIKKEEFLTNQNSYFEQLTN